MDTLESCNISHEVKPSNHIKNRLGYTILRSNHYDDAIAFYSNIFAEFGWVKLFEEPNLTSFGTNRHKPMFAICQPLNNQPASIANGSMITLHCQSVEEVDRLFDRVLSLGAVSDGDAGTRFGAGFYAAYFRDLDGHKLNFYTIVDHALF